MPSRYRAGTSENKSSNSGRRQDGHKKHENREKEELHGLSLRWLKVALLPPLVRFFVTLRAFCGNSFPFAFQRSQPSYGNSLRAESWREAISQKIYEHKPLYSTPFSPSSRQPAQKISRPD
jgi:hypothetical protein